MSEPIACLLKLPHVDMRAEQRQLALDPTLMPPLLQQPHLGRFRRPPPEQLDGMSDSITCLSKPFQVDMRAAARQLAPDS
eukprot:11220152-Alexandrium_andersonii.AAC.1